MFNYVVLGAGMQGTCAAYDLAKNGDADKVFICDIDEAKAIAAAERVNKLLGSNKVSGINFNSGTKNNRLVSIQDRFSVFLLENKINACLSCVPFEHNEHFAEECVRSCVHFNDLGGNTQVVKNTLKLDEQAKKQGVSIVPDCGVAPGMINVLSNLFIKDNSNAKNVQIKMYCGGLPQNSELPFRYKLLFNPGGLTNEYMGKAQLIRDGKLCEIDTLGDVDNIVFDGYAFESCVTSGGTSTCPEELEGKIDLYQYRTLRYPGHWQAMKAFKEIGMFNDKDFADYEEAVTYRDVFHGLAYKKFNHPEEKDVLYLHISASEKNSISGNKLTLIDKHDDETGFTAMERTTAFGATIITIMQAQGKIKPGARTPMSAVEDPNEYFGKLLDRGFKFNVTVTHEEFQK